MNARLLALLLVGAAGTAVADPPPPTNAPAPVLRHDPFRRPGGTSTAAPQTVEAQWRPQLRGVLLSGRQSLANVEGQMVGIGESLDGHRLLSVTEYQAVFEKDGRRTTLDMRRPLREPSP